MGGTTAKAGLVENGEVLRTEAIEVGGGVMAGSRLLVGAGYMLKLPAIDLAEVGAGGGSICRLDSAGAPKVGPESAGAEPGPVCYGRGGTAPTITDCNLVLGYLDPGGLTGGTMRLDLEAARAAIAARSGRAAGLSVEEAAHGMLRLASATMMRAIRAVSVERGRDPRQFAMLAFGGNGPLFAAGIAAELGIVAHHHSAAAGRVQRVRAAGGRRRTSRPPEHPGAAGSGRSGADQRHPGRADRGRGATAGARWLCHRSGRFSSAPRSARYAGQSSEIEVALPDGDISPAHDCRLCSRRSTKGPMGSARRSSEPVELMGLSVMARGLPEQPRLPGRIPPFAQGGACRPPRLVSAARAGWRRRSPTAPG